MNQTVKSEYIPQKTPEPSSSTVLLLPREDACGRRPPAALTLNEAQAHRLTVLRELLAASRLQGRQDIERAFMALAVNASAPLEAYGVTLFHTLSAACSRRIAFHCRACPRASEDEWWLLRLLEALERRDILNVEALLGFRIKKAWRRRVRFLAAGMAQRLNEAG